MGRAWWVAALLLVAGAAAGPGAARAQEEGEEAGVDAVDPVDVNDANVSDLLEIPGMDPDLARAIVAFRRESGPVDSVEALYRSPALTPARLLAVRPWLLAERHAPGFAVDLSASVRSTSLPAPREDLKLGAGRGAFHAALRMKRGLPPDDQGRTSAAGGVLRARPLRGLTLHAGDAAPVAGFGLLLGISGRPPVRGALTVPDSPPWSAREDADLRRGAPAPDGRRLRGAAAAFGERTAAGAFSYEPGATASTEDEAPSARPRVLFAEATIGRARGSAFVTPRVLHYDGRPWCGMLAAFPLAGGRAGVEVARDPENRFRYAVAAEGRGGRRAQFRVSSVGGSAAFVNPLGGDSERAPASARRLSTGRNENRDEAAFLARVTPVRRLAFEVEARGAVEPSTSRRAWDRPVGTGIARLEASPGSGWSLAAETRVETRGAPGPSAEADAPVRRHTAKLTAAWQRGRSHLRLEWQGRFDVDVPPGASGNAPLGRVQDLVLARARWPVASWLWIGGGVANYRLPSDAPAVLYEERPVGLSPGVFVRGTEERWHAALGFRAGGLEGGAFAAGRRGSASASPAATSWGLVLRLRRGP